MEKTSILIIEDHDEIRTSTAAILELANYRVLQASDGKEGIDLAIRKLPDIILCDVMMPEMDGYGVLHLLRKREDTALIPFIFISAKVHRDEVRKGIEMGADDYLTKPFDDIELLSAIECRLRKTELQKNLYSSMFGQIRNISETPPGLSELRKIFDARKTQTFKKKQIIYYEGDRANTLYLIISGEVKTTKMTPDGKEIVTGIYGPEEYFGIISLLAGTEYKETAEVLEDVTVTAVPKEIIEPLLKKYPDIAGEFTRILALHIVEHEEQLLHLAYYSVRKRMAEALLKLYTKNNSACIDASRENLAAMAGMAAETVSRILSDFRDEHLIERNAGKIIILDVRRLQLLKN
ncbi:response regulator [Chryseobacterium koreense]|uniref:response regulator n=1 Tax=Chryseobacterium koreense TaxID=232216 RepID=UPI0026EC8B2A|nr:response regulator [Chryseobacterium koreense]